MMMASRVYDILKSHSIASFGTTLLSRPLSMDLYSQWIRDQSHKDMLYLESHHDAKSDPQSSFNARSAIVLTIPYVPQPWPTESALKASRIALYAQSEDYHHLIPKTLQPLLETLKAEFPAECFFIHTDSVPLLERDLAYKAGLGWIGKNTCLIQRDKGSLFFIAEILTSLELPNENPWSPDFCGKCNRCIEACPTSALTADRKLTPDRCIAYWTIEAKSLPPTHLRPAIGDWLFGCDICQTVCPWNQKTLVNAAVNHPGSPRSESEDRDNDLKWILSSSRKELARALQDTPLSRAAGWKLQRNAIIVAVNEKRYELLPLIEHFRNDPKLQNLVKWAGSELKMDKL